MTEKLRILKPKTRPIQIEPWFFRYLNEGQIKLVAAIISHADTRDRTNNSFPSNRTLAFYCGFGEIIHGTKAYEKYSNLNEQEKIEYDKRRKKNAKQTVKNIKKSLEEIGILKREITGSPGKQIVYLTLDLNWKRNQYIEDFNKFFNEIENNDSSEDIENMLQNLIELSKSGSSNENILNSLNELENKIKTKINPNQYSEQDAKLLVSFIMNSNKIKTKIENKEISSVLAYQNKIHKLIINNKYEGIDKIKMDLLKHEEEKLIEILNDCMMYDNPTIEQNGTNYKFVNIYLKENLFFAKYIENKKTIDFVIAEKTFKNYTNTLLKKLSSFTNNKYKEYEKNFQKYKTEYSQKVK